jgi:hypothetical protein
MKRVLTLASVLCVVALTSLTWSSHAQRELRRTRSSSHHLVPTPSPTPKDICPLNGTAFEIGINEMPIPNPTPRRIDSMCPRSGSNEATTTHGAQNEAKNNFLAEGTPDILTFADFTELQRLTGKKIASGEIAVDDHEYPAERTQLNMAVNGKPLSEGKLVTLEGLVYSAHYSNTKWNKYKDKRGSGESNNCNCNRVDFNDIHIALVEKVTDGECNSVTAEISPHYRPILWSRFHDGGIFQIQKDLPGLLRNKVVAVTGSSSHAIRVRITGPLFYDASHKPCTFKSSGAVFRRESPARRTIWEIHPVYRIQVFDPSKTKWVELEEWAHL